MKCPCCKYEYVEAQYDFVKEDYVVRSGKDKGKTKEKDVYKAVTEEIGDERFNSVRVITNVRLSSWSNSLEIDTDEDYLNICPKCGVVFKEVG